MTGLDEFRVLLVDDCYDDRRLAREGAMRASSALNIAVHVAEASDGVAALKAAKSRVPDLILLDINMPRMNGLEVLSAVRADPLLEGVPVVVISTSQADFDIEAAYRGGVNADLVKPMDFELYRAAVDRAVQFFMHAERPRKES